MLFSRKPLKELVFQGFLCYNKDMKNEVNITTSSTEMMTISRAEYESLKAERDELNQKLDWLMEQVRLAKKKVYGTSSEQTKEELVGQLSFMFDETEAWLSTRRTATRETRVAAHTRQKRSSRVEEVLPENIPVEVVEHRVPESERNCPECGTLMTEIGTEVRRTLVMVPAQVKIREDVYFTYACQNCKQTGTETPILKAPKEPPLISGSYASPEAVAHIMVQKFVMYAPLYRQEQEWNRAGVMLSRQTMSNWVLRVAEDWLRPIYDHLHRQLLQREVLHADETTLQVLKLEGQTARSKCYMWLYRTSGCAEQAIVLYEYQSTRKAEHAENFLKGFSGWLHTDGYQGYHKLPENIRVVGCWAHARRKFDEALQTLPKEKQKDSPAAIGECYCSRLFKLEEAFAELTPEERYEKRLEQEKPVLDALLSWANEMQVKTAPKSAMGRAIHYLLEQWPYLTRYLEDGRLELSNNRAERSIKPFVMGRKNWLFANTPGGAQASSVIYSLIETAKENGLDPYRYLLWLLQNAPGLSETDEAWAEKLLPARARKNAICLINKRPPSR